MVHQQRDERGGAGQSRQQATGERAALVVGSRATGRVGQGVAVAGRSTARVRTAAVVVATVAALDGLLYVLVMRSQDDEPRGAS